jgi:hypothetical protein
VRFLNPLFFFFFFFFCVWGKHLLCGKTKQKKHWGEKEADDDHFVCDRNRQGGYATRILAKELSLRPIPEGWSYFDAAGLFVTAPTSYGALVQRAGVKKGKLLPTAHQPHHPINPSSPRRGGGRGKFFFLTINGRFPQATGC